MTCFALKVKYLVCMIYNDHHHQKFKIFPKYLLKISTNLLGYWEKRKIISSAIAIGGIEVLSKYLNS